MKGLFFAFLFLPSIAFAQTSIPTIDQWKFDGTNITQRTDSRPIKITGLSTGLCLTLNGSSILTTTSCGSGGSGSGAATSSFSATYPLKLTLSTSAINYSLLDLATTTASCSGTVSCTAFTIIGSSPVTITGSGSSGSGNIATSGPDTKGKLVYFTSTNATPATVAGTATSTLTPSSPLTGSFVQIGSSGALGVQAASASQNGYLAAIDYSLLHTSTTTFSSPLSYAVSTNAVTCPTCRTSADTLLQVLTAGNDGGGLNISDVGSVSGTVINATSTSGTSTITNALQIGSLLSQTNMVQVNCTGNFPASVTTGGCANITDSGTGPALIVNVTGTGANGRGASFDCTSASFGDNCVNIQSPETGSSILNIQGAPNGLGIVKVGSNGVGTTNSSVMSLDAHTSGFQGMALFLKCSGQATSTEPCWQTLDASANTIFVAMNSGNFGIATSAPGTLLSISSNINFTNATSTFANGGINLLNGCFAVNGTCIGGSSGGSGIGTVATSGLETAGQIAVWGTSSGYPAKLYSVATSTPTATAPITYSGTFGSFVGGTGGTFGCTTASAGVTGCLSGADWSTFNNKQTALSGGVNGMMTAWSGTGSLIATSTVLGGSFIATSTTATSTIAYGLDMNTSGGCIAQNGTCLDSKYDNQNAVPIGTTYPAAYIQSASSGFVTLYTAPAGRRAIIRGVLDYNPTAGNINLQMNIVLNGSHQLVGTITTSPGAASNSPSPFSAISPITLEPGESLSASTSASGLNISSAITEYPASVPAFTASSTVSANILTNLYTVPVGKTATRMSLSPLQSDNQTGCFNGSASSMTFSVYITPNGGTPYQAIATSSAISANNAGSVNATFSTLGSGDAIGVMTTQSTVWCWMNVIQSS